MKDFWRQRGIQHTLPFCSDWGGIQDVCFKMGKVAGVLCCIYLRKLQFKSVGHAHLHASVQIVEKRRHDFMRQKCGGSANTTWFKS